MKWRRRTAAALLLAAALFVGGAGGQASAGSQTIPLAVSLDDLASVNATVTVQQPTVQNGQLIITGTISGSATVAGITATVPTQTITVTAAASCKSGTGTLTLTTSPISASLSTGVQATIGSLSATVTATCGRTPTLTATLSPATATLSDGTKLSTSQCTVTLSAPASTTIGGAICSVHDLVCNLAEALAAGSAVDAVSLLNQTLNKLTATIGSL